MEKLDIILKALDDKIAENVVSIDLKGKSSIDEIEFQLKKNNMDCLSTEGYKDGNWILLDCGEIVVHIMTKDYRSYYNLERLWA